MRPRPGELVAGLGGLGLAFSLWLDWYAIDLGIQPPGTRGGQLLAQTGWQAFSVTDVVAAAYALLALSLPVIVVTSRGPAKAIGSQVIASALGGFVVLLIAYRLLNQPGPNNVVVVRSGAWIGLGAAIVAWVGAWLALRDESTPGAAAPALSARPAPPT